MHRCTPMELSFSTETLVTLKFTSQQVAPVSYGWIGCPCLRLAYPANNLSQHCSYWYDATGEKAGMARWTQASKRERGRERETHLAMLITRWPVSVHIFSIISLCSMFILVSKSDGMLSDPSYNSRAVGRTRG